MMTSLRHGSGVILAVVACIALLAGCGRSPTPTIEAVESPAATMAEESPLPSPEGQSETIHSPDPTPTPVPAPASVLPTPSSSDAATVGGVFLRDLEDGRSEPGVNTKLQLARVIRSEDGTPLVASAGEKSSPTAITNENGSFVFTDIPADTYVLVVVTPLGSFMIKDRTGEDLFIDVQPGKVVDLGDVHTDLPY